MKKLNIKFDGMLKTCKMLVLALGAAASLNVFADVSVDWTSPADGSSYLVGTDVQLTGVAGASGVIGTGLDLVLVLDSSGSMTSVRTSGGVTQSLANWQKSAAITLVNSLPLGTSVGIVEFDSDAQLVTGLVSLSVNKAGVIAAINATDASGGTNIPFGINAAVAELTSVRATAGFSQQIVVFSDGVSSGNPAAAAAAALLAGVEAVHSVALPGSSVSVMNSIATSGNGTFVDVTSGNLSSLETLFSGTGFSLVGLDRVEVTLPDGTVTTVVADAFGNFSVDRNITLGAQSFTATAYGTDGSVDSAFITLNGYKPSVGVPEPSGMLLLGLGLLGLGFARRRQAAR